MAYRFNQGDRPLPGYTIQRGVGRGGFGEVYYATSDGGKEVALKYLAENPQVELRGVSHCLNLKSPHLVTIYDVQQTPSEDFFVIMEYVNGVSLRDLLNESLALLVRRLLLGGLRVRGLRLPHEEPVRAPGEGVEDEGQAPVGGDEFVGAGSLTEPGADQLPPRPSSSA